MDAKLLLVLACWAFPRTSGIPLTNSSAFPTLVDIPAINGPKLIPVPKPVAGIKPVYSSVPDPVGIAQSSSGFLMNSQRKIFTSILPGSCPFSIPIVNRSLSCQYHQTNRVQLSDNDLRLVLSSEGGSYVPMYMAVTEEEAQAHFKNLIPLEAEYQSATFEPHPVNWSWNYSQTKRELLNQLDRAYGEFYQSPSTHGPPVVSTTNMEGNSPFNVTNMNKTADRLEKISITRGSDGKYNFTNIKALVMENLERWRNLKLKLPLNIINQILPADYIYPENKRRRRSVTGAVSTTEYCIKPGYKTTDGYLRLCSTCAQTTTLRQDHFPRILNEVWCDTHNNGCLYVNGHPHGVCRQSVFYISMLRRKPNTCMTIIKDGVHYTTDEWERYDQPIKVGCECLLDKRSVFAKYVKP